MTTDELACLSDDELRQYAGDCKLIGNFEDALACYQVALARHPRHAGIILEIIRCHQKLRDDDALRHRVLEVHALLAGQPGLIDQLGDELQRLHHYDLALDTFQMLRTFSASQVQAVGRAREAALHFRLGRNAVAMESLNQALSLGGHLPEVRFTEALLCKQIDPARSRSILSGLSQQASSLPAPFIVGIRYTLASVCDSLGSADEALAALSDAKSIEQSNPLITRFRQERPAWRKWHLDSLDASWDQARRWHDDAAADQWPAHAFLLGHPRSGTTLLEQFLDAHPRIASIEESNWYSTRIDAALTHAYPNICTPPFAAIPVDAINLQRAAYFRSLSREVSGAPSDSLLLDKNPALTISAAAIRRTMPMSRLIVMLRDPRDVCLSAYFQPVDRTTWSANWLTMEEAVDQYVFTMDLWRRTRERLVQPYCEIHYEKMVRDPIAEAKRVTSFLGLPWDDAQADHTTHARGKIVRSPTHAEVTQPVHLKAVGKWKPYTKLLAPFMEKLQPFIDAPGA